MSQYSPLQIEHLVRQIVTQQEINGVNFDKEKAEYYVGELSKRKDELYGKIRPHLRMEVVIPYSVPISRPFLADRSHSKSVSQWYGDDIPSIGGPFTRVGFDEPDIGSRKKLIAQLLYLGWTPSAYTEKGNPKLTVDKEPCPNIRLIDSEVGGYIADFYSYSHRQSQIQGWLDKLRPDGRLTAGAITIGTPTFRFRHTIVVNVPKAADYVLFGREMRSLFIPDDGYVLVGHDASGLELRMLAHYINDDAFFDAILNGDIHTKNQHDAGLPSRDDAKTFIYAWLYGAGNLKIGRIIGGSEAEGKKIKAQFLKANPKLKALIKAVQTAAKRGYLLGIDGRKVYLRRDKNGKIQLHKALNTLLQTAGALVMKYSMVILDEWVREMDLRVKKVIDMHDEAQASVHPDDAEMYGMLACYSIEEAGRQLGLRIPLAGEYKIGRAWDETH